MAPPPVSDGAISYSQPLTKHRDCSGRGNMGQAGSKSFPKNTHGDIGGEKYYLPTCHRCQSMRRCLEHLGDTFSSHMKEAMSAGEQKEAKWQREGGP